MPTCCSTVRDYSLACLPLSLSPLSLQAAEAQLCGLAECAADAHGCDAAWIESREASRGTCTHSSMHTPITSVAPPVLDTNRGMLFCDWLGDCAVPSMALVLLVLRDKSPLGAPLNGAIPLLNEFIGNVSRNHMPVEALAISSKYRIQHVTWTRNETASVALLSDGMRVDAAHRRRTCKTLLLKKEAHHQELLLVKDSRLCKHIHTQHVAHSTQRKA